MDGSKKPNPGPAGSLMRQAGRKGRTVIKHVIALLPVTGETLLKRVVRLPKRQHIALHRGKIGLVRNRLKHDAPFFVNVWNCSRLPPKRERPIRDEERRTPSKTGTPTRSRSCSSWTTSTPTPSPRSIRLSPPI